MPASIVAALNQVSQIGAETTPGTPVVATRRLVSMGLPLNPSREIQEFRPPGFKFSTGHVQTREWSEGSIGDGSGVSYNEIQYALCSLLSNVTPVLYVPANWAAATPYTLNSIIKPLAAPANIYKATSITGTGTSAASPPTWASAATLGSTIIDNPGANQITWTNVGPYPTGIYDWTFDISTYNRDTIKTYTIETGDNQSGRSYRASFCFFTGLELASVRDGEVTISGDLLGNRRSSFTLTGGAAEASLIPATPSHFNVYVDATSAALGTTQLDGNFSSTVSLTDRASHAWFHGRNYTGPAGRVETPPSATFELIQADGTEVDNLLTSLGAGSRSFFRYEWVGQNIPLTAIPHELVWDVAGTIADAESWGETQNVWAATLPFVAEHDGTWGRAMRVRVRNNMATL